MDDLHYIGAYSGRIAAWLHVWQRCRDAVAGQDAIKYRGEFYLPRPPGMEKDDVFLFYLRSATWFGASNRTMQGLHGTLFRRLPQIPKFPDWAHRYQDRLNNIDGYGHSILDLAKIAAWEQLIVGRYGCLICGNFDDDPIPRVSMWGAEQIIGLRYRAMRDGTRKLVHLRLLDAVETPEVIHGLRLRVILLEINEKGYLEKRIFLSKDKIGLTSIGMNPYTPSPFPYLPHAFWGFGHEGQLAGSWAGLPLQEISTFSWGDFTEDKSQRETPTRRGEALDFIPFVFFEPMEAGGTTALTPNPPPILDLVNENIAHYRASASYERARYRLSDPLIVIHDDTFQRQLQTEKEPLQVVGGDRAFVLSSAGKVTVAGLDPQALKALRDPLDMRRENMALLGSRLLETPRKLVEATKTHELRIGSENATLVDVADASERQLNEIIRLILWWSGEDDDMAKEPGSRFSYQRDFIPMGLDPNRIKQLLESLMKNAISLDTFLHNLQMGEGLMPGRTIEEEKAAIETEKTERRKEEEERLAAGLSPQPGGPAPPQTNKPDDPDEPSSPGTPEIEDMDD